MSVDFAALYEEYSRSQVEFLTAWKNAGFPTVCDALAAVTDMGGPDDWAVPYVE